MRRPWKQHNEFSELESELRKGRPEPRRDLISQLVGRVEETRVPFRRNRARLALAGALTSGALVAFALAGGFSYTASAASAVAHATGISKAHSSNAGGNGNGNGGGNSNSNSAKSEEDSSSNQYQEKVVICHRPPGNPSNAQTLTLSPQGAANHLKHHPDDTLGPCP
jgi:hypothetical protein